MSQSTENQSLNSHFVKNAIELLKKLEHQVPKDVVLVSDSDTSYNSDDVSFHKEALELYSEYFANLFKGRSFDYSYKEQKWIIPIDGFNGETLKAFKDFVYTGKIDNEKSVTSLFEFAQKYKVHALKQALGQDFEDEKADEIETETLVVFFDGVETHIQKPKNKLLQVQQSLKDVAKDRVERYIEETLKIKKESDVLPLNALQRIFFNQGSTFEYTDQKQLNEYHTEIKYDSYQFITRRYHSGNLIQTTSKVAFKILFDIDFDSMVKNISDSIKKTAKPQKPPKLPKPPKQKLTKQMISEQFKGEIDENTLQLLKLEGQNIIQKIRSRGDVVIPTNILCGIFGASLIKKENGKSKVEIHGQTFLSEGSKKTANNAVACKVLEEIFDIKF
uniref:CSON014702 protein n=1 Tax=Culicoides sonorensis TaxID=179676 RepID=A0A336MCJ0_CULSO